VTSTIGGWQADHVLVGRFTTPPQPLSSIAGMVSFVEYVDGPADRWMTLSTSACDFRDPDPTGQNGPIAVGNGQTPSISSIMSTNGSWAGVVLRPGTTYYVNVLNRRYGGTTTTCTRSTCNGLLTLSWPR
jgi:hypothetical protein